MKEYKIYGPYIIAFLFLSVCAFMPSVYQKGGVDFNYFYFIAVMAFVFSLLVTFLRTIKFPAGFMLSAFNTVIALYVTAFSMFKVVDFIYGENTFQLWETKHRLFVNAIFYGMIILLQMLMVSIYKRIRRKMAKRKRAAITTQE